VCEAVEAGAVLGDVVTGSTVKGADLGVWVGRWCATIVEVAFPDEEGAGEEGAPFGLLAEDGTGAERINLQVALIHGPAEVEEAGHEDHSAEDVRPYWLTVDGAFQAVEEECSLEAVGCECGFA
jgi:hypothetical protein